MECWQITRETFLAPFRDEHCRAAQAFDAVNQRHYPDGSLPSIAQYAGPLARLEHEHDLQERYQGLVDDPSYRRALVTLHASEQRLRRMESRHRSAVRAALRAGLDVPPEVRAAYARPVLTRTANK